MRFDQDNTISDRPMVDVITSLEHMLGTAAARAGASAAGSGAALHQLVLIIADGRCVGASVRELGGPLLCSRGWRRWHSAPPLTSRATGPPPGRFHEKENLRRMVRAAADRPGVLYAFIVLDNPANSILDMQVGVGCSCEHGSGSLGGPRQAGHSLPSPQHRCAPPRRADGVICGRQAGVCQVHGLLPLPLLHRAARHRWGRVVVVAVRGELVGATQCSCLRAQCTPSATHPSPPLSPPCPAAALTRTLADLMRQWFELSSHTGP